MQPPRLDYSIQHILLFIIVILLLFHAFRKEEEFNKQNSILYNVYYH